MQKSEQFALEIAIELSDLVQKERASVGDFYQSWPVLPGPGERAFLVAKQFTLEEARGNGGTVQFDKWRLPPVGAEVQKASDKFLAGPALALNKHGKIGGEHTIDPLSDFAHGCGPAEDDGFIRQVSGVNAKIQVCSH